MKKLTVLLLLVSLLFTAALAEDSGVLELSAEEFAEMFGDDVQLQMVPDFYSEDLASAGNLVWGFASGTLCSYDPAACEEKDEIDLSELFSAGDSSLQAGDLTLRTSGEVTYPGTAAMVPYGDGLLIAVPVLDAAEKLYVPAFEFSVPEDGGLKLEKTYDLTESLSAFFRDNGDWTNPKLLCAGKQVFVYAENEDLNYDFFALDAEKDSLKELGTVEGWKVSCVFPYNDSLMLALFDEAFSSSLSLKVCSADGITDADGKLNLTDGISADGCCYDPESGLLYFTSGTVAMRAAFPSEDKPTEFAVFSEASDIGRNGLLCGGYYVTASSSGGIRSCSVSAALSDVRLKIANSTYEESVSAAGNQFNAAHPDCVAMISEGVDTSDILENMMNRSSDYDVYVVDISSDGYDALRERGYMAELNGSTVLTEAAADMTEQLRSKLTSGESLLAIPLSTYGESMAFNVEALCALTGKSEEELPTTWKGFFELLGEIADRGLLEDNSEFTLNYSGYSIDEMRSFLMIALMKDCWLWLDRNENNYSRLIVTMQPVLSAFDAVDWTRLGLGEQTEENSDWYFTDSTALIGYGYPDIAEWSEDTETIWPLTVEEGGDRLIAQYASVAFVNPFSEHPDLALDFVERAWNATDLTMKTALCLSRNDPIENADYAETMKYFDDEIALYEEAVAQAQEGEDTAELKQELEEAKANRQEYEEKGRWQASAGSIARYREYQSVMMPVTQSIWTSGSETQLQQYLDGAITSSQLLSQLESTLKMRRLEGY